MKLLVIAGARPNFMKIAPLMEAFHQRRLADPHLQVLLVHTGQHYDQRMSDDFFRDLQLPQPDINLNIGSGSHAEQTARVMMAFEPVCLAQRPDWVVVVGDVNSTIACALTACKLGIRVAHVEAGLRSHDRSMPEEINRLCTDAIADLLFTTEPEAGQNLRREGVSAEKIHFVGNTMIDTLVRFLDAARARPLPDGMPEGAFGVLTLHRPSNVDDRQTLSSLVETMARIACEIPLVFPIHPRTRARLAEFGLLASLEEHPGLRLLDPLGYLAFVGLVARARMVLTDSGGIQEETTYLGVPCITLRSNTERPITCTAGTNMLVGNAPEAIRRAAAAVLNGRAAGRSIPEKWDGQAGRRIVEVLLEQRTVAQGQRL
jgi:UDP-N-acetylglucosamine 2-epimerase (non-hydrolysing)